MEQLSLFEKPLFQINKPIRLIELFAGIGSQAKALKNLGANFETYRVVEFDKYAIASYNAIHNTNFETSDITKISANDLGIVDRDIYIYILTYSFPCQDLSLAGKRKGMDKGSGTRSGLLWEVERLLDECKGNLPQVLLMENVPQVIGKSNIDNFNKWYRKLNALGYSNFYQVLNAKDYGIPQNRKRCFMVSILGDYDYQFPKGQELKLTLKDLLEKNVDEKYFLSEKMMHYLTHTNKTGKFDRNEIFQRNLKRIEEEGISGTLTTKEGQQATNVYVKDRLVGGVCVKNATKQGFLIANEGDGIDISSRMHYHRGTVQKGLAQTLKTQQDIGVCESDLRIRKLTPKECYRLMGFSDEDYEKASQVCSQSQLYKQAGNSIVVNVLEAIFKQML